MTIDYIAQFIRGLSAFILCILMVREYISIWFCIIDLKCYRQDLTRLQKLFVWSHGIIAGFIVGWAWLRLLI